MSNIFLLVIVIGVLVVCVLGFGLFGVLCEVGCILIIVSICFFMFNVYICVCIYVI